MTRLAPLALAAGLTLALPAQAFLDTPDYRDKFVDAIAGSHGAEQTELTGRLLSTYQAQLLRDNTMAERIYINWLQATART